MRDSGDYIETPLTKRLKPAAGSENEPDKPKKRKRAPLGTESPLMPACGDSVGLSLLSPSNSNIDGGLTGHNAYLGSTSFLSVFHETVPQLSHLAMQPLPPEFARWQNKQLSLQSQLLKLITSFDLYEKLIGYYYERGLFSIVPASLTLGAVKYARAHLATEDLSNIRQKNLYRKICQNTAKPLEISATASAEEFFQLFTGENLRWEFIGLIFALAGLGVVNSLTHTGDKSLRFADGEIEIDESFSTQMVVASNNAIEMCRQHDKVNDLTIWLEYNHCVLISMVLDETSHLVYRCFGDLISDMFSLGYHREQPPGQGIPLFLSQTRKRIFTAAYRSDKNLATFLGRPPRIQSLYCDAGPPLDLDDNSLILQGDALTAALQNLDEDGWNRDATRDNRIRSATVIRVRFIISLQREKVLELSLGRKPSNFIEVLYKTYQECQDLWASIPHDFRYDVNCWKTLDPFSCVAILVIYLEYLHGLFQIQRILCQQNLSESSSLLNTSMQLLSTVLHLLKQPEHTPEMQTNFSWIFLFYGLPASGVLASELYQSTLSASIWPSTITFPRSQIIRDLGRIISWFETATLPPTATSRVCVDITKVLSRLLDDALNYQPSLSQHSQSSHGRPHQHAQLPVDGRIGTEGRDSAVEISPAAIIPGAESSAHVMTRPGDEQMQQPPGSSLEQAQLLLPHDNPEIGIGIDDQFTSEKFLSWLDDLDWDATVPDLLF
ncbi:hypothetical protein LOZ65_001211 [Ophidiomyces ophidiicola]|nr:hypothetical protein LOZ65_001211 [Ophidiomyces ophidiicola]